MAGSSELVACWSLERLAPCPCAPGVRGGRKLLPLEWFFPGPVLSNDSGAPVGLLSLCNDCKGKRRDLVFQIVRMTRGLSASSEQWQQAPLTLPTLWKVKNT